MSLPHNFHDDVIRELYHVQSPHQPYAQRDSLLLQEWHSLQYRHQRFLFPAPSHEQNRLQRQPHVQRFLRFEEQEVHPQRVVLLECLLFP